MCSLCVFLYDSVWQGTWWDRRRVREIVWERNMKVSECLIILTWWGCNTVRTIVSLQRLWKNNRQWSWLDNTRVLEEELFLAVLQLRNGLTHLQVCVNTTHHQQQEICCSLLILHPLYPCPLFSHPGCWSPGPPPPPTLHLGTVKDVTLQGLWLSLVARRSPTPR